MPLKMLAPIEKEFDLIKTDAYFNVKDGSTKVLIRQATQSGKERREGLWANVIRELNRDPDEDLVRLIQRFSLEELKRIETFLTLRACNILDENGKMLFNFDSHGNIKEQDFNDAWGSLDPMVAQDIYDCVLEVNIDWRPVPLET
jgi:hypothetical protein